MAGASEVSRITYVFIAMVISCERSLVFVTRLEGTVAQPVVLMTLAWSAGKPGHEKMSERPKE